MIFGLFTLAVAIVISAVSAFYSITGLTAIFTGALWPIVIMGATLELGKITGLVWLHKYWNRAGWQFKLYLVPAIVVLMLITSMGTFGFLSASHLSQSTANEDISAQVSIFDDKIKTEQDNIAANKKALAQMDSQVDQILGRTTDDRGASKAAQLRKSQAKERSSLQADIAKSQNQISQLQAEREPIAAKSRVAESHIGPIKYIAALIYGDNPDANLLERAVRWVIILLVLVFDPLALILILAAEQTVEWSREDDKKSKLQEAADQAVEWANTATPEEINKELDKIEGWHQEWVPDSEAWPEWDDEITEEQIEAIKTAAGNVEMTSMSSSLFDTEREFFDHGKELARELDANHGYLNKPWAWPSSTGNVGLVAKEEPAVVEPETYTLLDSGNTINVVLDNPAHADRFDPEPIQRPMPMAIQADNDEIVTPANSGFGTTFPADPAKGDLFIRVDYLPNRLFKYNGQRWIEVNKEQSDTYAYDEEYIKHLINKIDSGEYEVEMLSATEQEQIQRYLNEQSK